MSAADSESTPCHLHSLSTYLRLTPWHHHLPKIERLSERELQVFTLLGTGMSNRQVSRELAVSERTVKAHITQILTKLDLESRLQAGILSHTFQLLTACDAGACAAPRGGEPAAPPDRYAERPDDTTGDGSTRAATRDGVGHRWHRPAPGVGTTVRNQPHLAERPPAPTPPGKTHPDAGHEPLGVCGGASRLHSAAPAPSATRRSATAGA